MRDIDRTAAEQHALLTLDQLRKVWTDAAISKRSQRGLLLREHRGVYRLPGAPRTWEQRVMAACLARDGAVASRWAAAHLWGLEVRRPHQPIVTFPALGHGRRLRLRGVEAHESRVLDGLHVDVRDRIPVTSVARTVCDLTAVASPRTVARLADEALRRRLLRFDDLCAVFDDLATRGRRRSTVMREIIELRREGFDPGDSHTEVDLVQWLLEAGLAKPVQQHPIVLDGVLHHLDICYPALRINIEFDGFGTHRERLVFDDERARQNALSESGWTILRFTTRHARAQVVASVRRTIERLAPADHSANAEWPS
jgi:very-short-patch-repair endonuclease